jgi:hypothetical protein
MNRLHLFEFEDQKWFPAMFRDYMTEIMRYANNLVYAHSIVLPLIKEVLTYCKDKKIVDLCSGGVGPWDQLYKELVENIGPISLVLTDKYPNKEMSGNRCGKNPFKFKYLAESIDARKIPDELQGMRTLFSGLHHFKENDVRLILKNSVDKNTAIGIFEFTERGFWAIAKLLLSPLFVLVVTPFLRPLSLARFFWTYIIPIIPVVFLWDGIVSCVRSYSTEELKRFTNGLKKEGYVWKVGTRGHAYPSYPIEITYLLGYPDTLQSGYEEFG